MSEYIQIRDPGNEEFWADYWLCRDPEGNLIAQGFINARNGGDAMMALVANTFNQLATDIHEPIIHEFVAANPASEALVMRTKGYSDTGDLINGHKLFTKIFG